MNWEGEVLVLGTHSRGVGYLLWIFGFIGAHRFYFGKRKSGVLWFFTGGLLGIGWIIDIVLIPSMEREAERNYTSGHCDYTLAWVLLTFFGYLGLHRFYQGKFFSGLIYLLSLGLFGIGILYDFLSLNEQVSEINERE